MRVESAWQRPQVLATCVGYTDDAGSVGGRMSCAMWQSVHVATAVSPNPNRRLPCTDVAYSDT